MVEYFGRDVDGALLSDTVAGETRDREMLLAGARTAIARNRPGIIEQILVDNGQEVLRQELTALPLLAPEGDARWILISTFSFEAQAGLFQARRADSKTRVISTAASRTGTNALAGISHPPESRTVSFGHAAHVTGAPAVPPSWPPSSNVRASG